MYTFLKPFKELASRVLSGLKPLARAALVVLNLIKHCCSFFKYQMLFTFQLIHDCFRKRFSNIVIRVVLNLSDIVKKIINV